MRLEWKLYANIFVSFTFTWVCSHQLLVYLSMQLQRKRNQCVSTYPIMKLIRRTLVKILFIEIALAAYPKKFYLHLPWQNTFLAYVCFKFNLSFNHNHTGLVLLHQYSSEVTSHDKVVQWTLKVFLANIYHYLMDDHQKTQ